MKPSHPPHPVPKSTLLAPVAASSTTGFSGWVARGGHSEDAAHGHDHARPWFQVLWLTGVDYFSTLGYQPGIALLAAGGLSPLATLVLVAVTLFGALPVYSEVARRSYSGQGSIAMLERLIPGWWGKVFVLIMLGFAVTDFVITMTLSAADATAHIMENPYLEPYTHGMAIPITLLLLLGLAMVFLRGFSEAIGLAMATAIPYMILSLVVAGRALMEVLSRPESVGAWRADLSLHGSLPTLLLAAGLTFPKLALGLSGFETGVSVMPQVRGNPPDPSHSPGPPLQRIAATRHLLTAAALMMSFMLLLSSFVTTLLIPESAYREGGEASGRALAWLAHKLLGHGFGTLYDLSTIVVLWFAGASAMAGLLNLIPRYLPRFGMAPRWVAFNRPLILVLFAIDVVVTLAFRADVNAQGGAYATGVLALILSASVAVALYLWREAGEKKRFPWRSLYFWGVAAVFAFTFVDNVLLRPDGVIIASLFIATILALSGLSRYLRSTEFRVETLEFADPESEELWSHLVGKKINLVPLEHYRAQQRRKKEREIRQHYAVKGPLAFLHVHLRDDRSDFSQTLKVSVRRWEDDYLVEVKGALAIANTIAYLSELLDPRSIFLGLTQRNPMSQALQYLLWGEGETGILVYQILIRYWAWTPEEDVRPLIFLMSEDQAVEGDRRRHGPSPEETGGEE